jgi:hypothetical protein
VLQKSGSQTTLRPGDKVIFGDNGVCRTKCHYCKTRIELPLEIRQGTDIPTERFIIRKVT